MRKTVLAVCLGIGVLGVLSVFGLGAYGQDKDRKIDHPNGIVQDWSRRHVAYPRFGPIRSLIAVEHDPRAILSWQAAEREDWHRSRNPRHFGGTQSTSSAVHQDWSISLGGGTTAPAMYPAKYTFDVNATPTCVAGLGVPIPDYIVYPVNIAGSGTQPNIVAFDNLYSGTTPTAGLCNRTPVGSDSGVSATTFWSYNVQAVAGGLVSTSPALSLDGTKVAFVETASGQVAHFHVLAWQSADQTVLTFTQSVSSVVTITTGGFATLAPVAGSGTATDLTLGSASDTLSSPFVDYANDLAYIGDDTGTLFRVINVFCTNAPCTGGGTPAPSLDVTWGTGGGLSTGCSGRLTGTVVDGGTGNIFVGCSDGKLYGFTAAGVALAGSPLSVGDGTATGGIVDPPMIDTVNGFVYVVSGSFGGSSVLVQASTSSFSSPAPVTATLGVGARFSLHAPAFNDAYFASGNSANWLIYEWALNGSGTVDALYGVGFGAGHVMVAGPAANSFSVTGSTPVEFSPLTEFLNGSTDQLYVSGLLDLSPNFILYNLTDFGNLFPNVLFPINSSNAVGGTTTEGSGTSGIVVDNVSTDAQASSIYFGVFSPGPNANSAVKLTQSGLQ